MAEAAGDLDGTERDDAPAAERSEARVHQIIDAAVTRGLEEVFGSGAA